MNRFIFCTGVWITLSSGMYLGNSLPIFRENLLYVVNPGAIFVTWKSI
ncbi:conserved domain protein [Bacteroides fluxus YIT 12057]|uniref:Conserved domain protein n=1 Tax=Bacteroides fluxus YIT 12057 TaxID=763034 RepID=F3PPS5_9BACE|nr:conserved domain protein [Bacteroides fluxus YIT 12057]